MKTLILGIGNLLLGDEGVGVHVVRELEHRKLPAGTRVLDIGTAILDALPDLEQADRVIVIDAMQAGGTPGTVYRIPLNRCGRSGCLASMHGFDLGRVMGLTKRPEPPETLVIGIEPDRLHWSMELSLVVERAIPLVLDAVQEEIGQPGEIKYLG